MVVYLWIQIHTNPITFRTMVLTAPSIMHAWLVNVCCKLWAISKHKPLVAVHTSSPSRNILIKSGRLSLKSTRGKGGSELKQLLTKGAHTHTPTPEVRWRIDIYKVLGQRGCPHCTIYQQTAIRQCILLNGLVRIFMAQSNTMPPRRSIVLHLMLPMMAH